MERKTLMRRGKRFAKRRERYETAEAALGPETPGAKAFAVSGDRVHAFIASTLTGTALAHRTHHRVRRLKQFKNGRIPAHEIAPPPAHLMEARRPDYMQQDTLLHSCLPCASSQKKAKL